jgi:hypothetical protein
MRLEYLKFHIDEFSCVNFIAKICLRTVLIKLSTSLINVFWEAQGNIWGLVEIWNILELGGSEGFGDV